jgi:hypothetical protein
MATSHGGIIWTVSVKATNELGRGTEIDDRRIDNSRNGRHTDCTTKSGTRCATKFGTNTREFCRDPK